MKVKQILTALYQSRTDLANLKLNPVEHQEFIMSSVMKNMEKRAPQSGGKLFKTLNFIHETDELPERIKSLEELIRVFESNEDKIDALIERTESVKNIRILPKTRLSIRSSVDLIIEEMLSNASAATSELRTQEGIRRSSRK